MSAQALAARLAGLDLVTDPDVLETRGHDDAEWAPAGKARAALRAGTTEDVSRAVAACAELGFRWSPGARAPACPAAPTRSTAVWCWTCRR